MYFKQRFELTSINNTKQLEDVACELLNLGFYKYVASHRIGFVLEKSLRLKDLFLDEAKRTAIVDSELLLESGVAEVLPKFKPFFDIAKIDLRDVQVANDDAGRVALSCESRTYPLWNDSETDEYLNVEKLCGALNNLLSDRGIDERIYFEYTGNDSLFVILSTGIYDYLKIKGVFKDPLNA